MRTGHVLFSCASEKKKRFDKAAALRLKNPAECSKITSEKTEGGPESAEKQI